MNVFGNWFPKKSMSSALKLANSSGQETLLLDKFSFIPGKKPPRKLRFKLSQKKNLKEGASNRKV
jgi:hypothetical protein